MKKFFTLIVMLVATLGMQAQDTWTVVGAKALCGVAWEPTETSNDMTSSDGVNFTLVKENVMLAAGDYEYKVAQNHAWDISYPTENAVLTIVEDGAYTVTFSFNATTTEVSYNATKTGDYVAPDPGSKTWTVAGVSPLCGSEWNAGDENNDMTSADGVVYTWTKTDVALEKGVGYGFKVCADHAWDESYGDGGGNFILTVDADGLYTVVISFNSETFEITVNTTKTGEASFGDKVWTIAGAADLLGSNWDPADTNNDMTKIDEGLYELVKKNVALLADTEYAYKVLANHSWSENYGANGQADGSNCIMMVDADAVYDVTFLFILETKDLSCDAALAAGVAAIKIEKVSDAPVYNLAGQRVNAAYRGIAIQNGRKVMVK